ncbi:NAD-dependent epimerase/dehydratase family protein [Georgenia muralis]
MRVVVVGATGNAGTAVLRALRAEPAVTSVLGLARRLPDRTAEPYADAEWATVDVGAPTAGPGEEDALVTRLAAHLAGADAVIHLAWLIQPNQEREVLRRANVAGTRRVAEACVRAGVGHLVCASSVGAYSPVDDDVPREESWPTGGIPTSHYSVDKVAQERVLDKVAAAHPDLVVSRLRPALIFQDDAGAEIVRYFLGPLVPAGLLAPGRLPVLPLPAGLRLQVVHADDVARAYVQVVVRRAPGAFNVAGEPVLRAADLARVVDHGRLVEVPPAALRRVLALAWQTRLVPTDAGWLDMGMGVPLMSTDRARDVLGWRPQHDAAATLAELLEGMAAGHGTASPPMRPAGVPDTPTAPAPSGASTSLGGTMGPHVPHRLDDGLLGLYLSDHLTGATGGLNRARFMAEHYADTALAPDLRRLVTELTEEVDVLTTVIDELGLPRRRYRQAAAWAGERVGRLKLNRRVLSRSPMTPLLEIELFRGAVMGKLGLWQVLSHHAADLGLTAARFDALAQQARDQAEMFDRLHARVRTEAFVRGDEVDAGTGR